MGQIKMEQIFYKSIGKVRRDYKHEPRIVTSHGLVTSSSLVLKFYSMMRRENIGKIDIESTTKFAKKEIEERKIKPYIGIGFTVLSEDMLNIARWDNNYPIVLMNDIYIYQNMDIKTAILADIRETGSFCIWELGIVKHERDAWKEFLASDVSNEQKRRYLDDFMEQGELK